MVKKNSKRTIWIIGASSGIGRALALRYAENGNTVFVSARTASHLKTLAEDAKKLAGKIYSVPMNVTKSDNISSAIRTILKKAGHIDIVVISAGIYKEMPLNKISIETFRATFEVNTFGAAECVMALLPIMEKQGGGKIGVISSIAGYRGLPRSAAYGASKAAITHFCEALLPEVRKRGIDLKVISPGFIETPMTSKNTFPMPFMISPEKAAARIFSGMDTKRFEITFPKRFTWFLKFIRILPYAIYNRIIAWTARDL